MASFDRSGFIIFTGLLSAIPVCTFRRRRLSAFTVRGNIIQLGVMVLSVNTFKVQMNLFQHRDVFQYQSVFQPNKKYSNVKPTLAARTNITTLP